MIKVLLVNPKIKSTINSTYNEKYKTVREAEDALQREDCMASPDWLYVVKSGAVKRVFKYNYTAQKWERVLHPRGTKRKVKQATPSAEVNTITSTPVKEVKEVTRWSEVNNRWIPGGWDYDNLVKQVKAKSTENPWFTPYRVTFNDGSVTYFTRDSIGNPLYETSEDPTVKKMEVTVSLVPVSVPWHVAYLDIVNNGAKYTCVYPKDNPNTFELEERDGRVKFASELNGLLNFTFTSSAVKADYYKKETK